ncbi:MAG: CoA transferase [Deltaproteobacteria bacterium]|nr:CoA transferase [Deltaproteobacteria bacterium]MBW2420849.1 CoA transferase [Deltaproteobacteria bacterium]
MDLSIALAGPWAGGILADQGASVIKVETPGIGDLVRWIGVSQGGISAVIQMCNRGKRSIAVNLREEEGRQIVRRLAREADVFLQNFRPGVIERLGLSYETLREENPNLIYASISGFGATGPYRDKSAYDPVVQAYAGLCDTESDLENEEPRLLNQTPADKVTALTAAQAISAALFARERGAGGQHIEIPMLEAVVNFMWADAAGNEILRDADHNQPSSFARGQKLWRYKDGYAVAAPVSDADFQAICEAHGVDGYDDPDVATMMARRVNRDAVQVVLDRVMEAAAGMSVDDAIGRMEAGKAPCGKVLSTAELHADPHVQARGILVDSEHPVAGRLRQPRPPIHFEKTPSAIGDPAPTLGQHTDELLRELGLSDDIARLREAGIVA